MSASRPPADDPVANDRRRRVVRVLIAEDSEDDAMLLVRQLRRSGFAPEFRRVEGDAELGRALDDAEWDLIITDYNMPQFSPDDVLNAVAARELDLPIILVSAHVADTRAADAMKAGVHDYVLKDNLSRLGPAIQRELREAENRRVHRDTEAELERLALRDPVTGLANRRQLEARLDYVLRSEDGRHRAFLYLDLDQFRVINDTCGHHGGDELVRALGRTLDGFVRDADTLARIGPDEFGVLLDSCPLQRAWRIAGEMHRAVNAYRFEWDGHSFQPGVSIGVVPLTGEGETVAEILRRADLACHTAKELGRNRIRLYSEDDTDLARRRGDMQWVGRLNAALERDEFTLYQQPVRALDATRAEPFRELLVRLVEPGGTLVEPGAFIAAAEHYALMPLIDRWVIRRSLETISRTPDAGTVWFLNLSATSLSEEGLTGFVGRELERNGIKPSSICFEITETAAIANMQSAMQFMRHVRELGCLVALDDFGSGLSSFNYLKSLPADFLKIDGMFVRHMLDDPVDYTIVEAVTRVGHAAGMRVIAEYAETDATIEALAALGVDYAQGFEIAHPAPLAEDGP